MKVRTEIRFLFPLFKRYKECAGNKYASFSSFSHFFLFFDTKNFNSINTKSVYFPGTMYKHRTMTVHKMEGRHIYFILEYIKLKIII